MIEKQATAVDVMYLLIDVTERLSYLINATPTGPTRNSLCNANMHVMSAIQSLKETV